MKPCAGHRLGSMAASVVNWPGRCPALPSVGARMVPIRSARRDQGDCFFPGGQGWRSAESWENLSYKQH